MTISKLHYINVGPKGTFHKSGDVQTKPQDIDAIIEHIEQHGLKKIAIHLHGGLINEKSGMEIAEKMLPVYHNAKSHSIAIVWETGLLETIVQNLNTIYTTKLFKKLLKHVILHAGNHLGLTSRRRSSANSIYYSDIEQNINKDKPFDDFKFVPAKMRDETDLLSESKLKALEQEIEDDIYLHIDEFKELLKEEALDTQLLDQSRISQETKEKRGVIAIIKAIVIIVTKVIKRYVHKTHHHFYPTVVEEILRYFYLTDQGAWVWNGMKNAAVNMWLPNNNLTGLDQHAGTYLLDKLAALQRRKPDIAIDLIGHSAGSIAICQMLKAAANYNLNLKIRHILFLAPACTADLFKSEIIDHPNRYQHFRMFTMRDDFECNDSLVKGLYTHSLLYFISGVLEDEVDKHILGMERYLSGKTPYDKAPYLAVKNYLQQEGTNRIVLSNTEKITPNAELGFCSTSETHGDFDDDPSTRDSLTHMIRE